MSGPRLIDLDAAAEYLSRELSDATITREYLYRCCKYGANGIHMNHMRGHRRRICFDSNTLLQDYLSYCKSVAVSMQSKAIPADQIEAITDDLNYAEM